MPTPPTPTRLKLLAGNPGKRPIQPEPEGKPFSHRCPAHLTGEARAAWAELVVLLAPMGHLQAQDRLAVEIAARLLERVRESGGRHLDSVRELRQWMVELGATPSSRSRVSAPPGLSALNPDEEAFAAHLRQQRRTPPRPQGE